MKKSKNTTSQGFAFRIVSILRVPVQLYMIHCHGNRIIDRALATSGNIFYFVIA